MAMSIRSSSFFLLLILCAAATASARGGSKLKSVPKQTKHAFDQSVDESQQDYNNWETTHHLSQNDINKVQSCSAKYNETISGLNNELVDLSNNATSNSTAQKNLTSYAQDQVRAAESERIRCLDTYLPSNSQPLTVHFTLSLPFVFFVLFSTFTLF